MTEILVGQATKDVQVVNRESFYVVADEKDIEGAKVTTALMQKNPNVLFTICRSCNKNVVAYEAEIDGKNRKRLRSEKPIVSVYWLNLEKKYADSARKKKQPHDCDQLSFPERKLAYGCKAKPIVGKSGVYRLKMNVLPSLPIHVGIDPKTNRPRATLELHPKGDYNPGTKGGTMAFLERIYVHVVFDKVGIPTVPWLTYFGISVADNKPVHQKVVRHKEH